MCVVKNDRGGVDIRNRPRIPIPDEDPYSVAGIQYTWDWPLLKSTLVVYRSAADP